jgi:hypothetical protein
VFVEDFLWHPVFLILRAPFPVKGTDFSPAGRRIYWLTPNGELRRKKQFLYDAFFSQRLERPRTYPKLAHVPKRYEKSAIKVCLERNASHKAELKLVFFYYCVVGAVLLLPG